MWERRPSSCLLLGSMGNEMMPLPPPLATSGYELRRASPATYQLQYLAEWALDLAWTVQEN